MTTDSKHINFSATETGDVAIESRGTVESRFDYSEFAEEAAAELKAFVDGIHRRVDGIRQRNAGIYKEVLAVGRDLIRAKPVLGHGRYGRWLKQEFGWSERTARNYTSVAELAQKVPSGKTEILADLPLTTLYLLGAESTPEGVRESVITELAGGRRFKPREVEDLVRAERRPRRKEKTAMPAAAGSAPAREHSPHTPTTDSTSTTSEEQRPPVGSAADKSSEVLLLARRVLDVIQHLPSALDDDHLIAELAEIASSVEGLKAIGGVMKHWSAKRRAADSHDKDDTSMPMAA
jgi:hypothetical protein